MTNEFDIKKTHVPDKVYAYMIQAYHMVYALIDCKSGDTVTMEVFDDVGVMGPNEEVEAIQIKSVTSDRNPISDRAVDFWKTLYNWLMAVKQHEIPCVKKTKFKLYITTMASGRISSLFSKANTETEVEAAINTAKICLFPNDDKKNLPDTYKDYVLEVLDDANSDIVKHIIMNFTIEMCEEKYSEVVRDKMKSLHIPDDLLDSVFHSVIGWINQIIAKSIENKKAISISYDDFNNQVGLIYREHNQRHSLLLPKPAIGDDRIQDEISNRRNYVVQLEIVNVEYEDKLEAVNDYLCAADSRTKYALQGLVSESQIMQYEKDLKKHWRNKQRINNIEQNKLPDEKKGQLLYYKCLEDRKNMQTMDVSDTFYNGCLHLLSNSLEIGWHPNYKEILESDYIGK